MATITLQPIISSISGRLGNLVFFSRYGKQYVRSYVIPGNPKSISQQRNRSSFANAVKSWQSLAPEEKEEWCSLAQGKGSTGYHYYLSMYMKGEAQGGAGSADNYSIVGAPVSYHAFTFNSPFIPLRFSFSIPFLYLQGKLTLQTTDMVCTSG